MITNGQDSLGIYIDSDQWTCVTADGKDSAFFEHMVMITDGGPKILTTHFNFKQDEL
jgi:methionyl aminopeptidase